MSKNIRDILNQSLWGHKKYLMSNFLRVLRFSKIISLGFASNWKTCKNWKSLGLNIGQAIVSHPLTEYVVVLFVSNQKSRIRKSNFYFVYIIGSLDSWVKFSVTPYY